MDKGGPADSCDHRPIAPSRGRADNGQLRGGRGRLKDEAGLGFDHRAQLGECLLQPAETSQIVCVWVTAVVFEGTLERSNLSGQS